MRTITINIMILLMAYNSGKLPAQNNYKKVNEAKGLPVGEVVENFSAKDVNDSTYSLNEDLKRGPVVLIFIRGQWCPVCNRHMSYLQDSLQMVYNKGANVVVVSPEKPEYIEETIKKTGAEFTILYDEGQKISDYFDVTFIPDGKTKLVYNTVLGAKLKESHTDDTERLPIPATFIIGKDNEIVWRQFDPDYKNRSAISDIIKNIPVN